MHDMQPPAVEEGPEKVGLADHRDLVHGIAGRHAAVSVRTSETRVFTCDWQRVLQEPTSRLDDQQQHGEGSFIIVQRQRQQRSNSLVNGDKL